MDSTNGTMITKSLGEKRVRVDFNVSNSSVVDKIKKDSASLINLLQDIRNTEVAATFEKSDTARQIESREKLELIDIAQRKYEEAAMWAVKAATA